MGKDQREDLPKPSTRLRAMLAGGIDRVPFVERTDAWAR